MLQCDHRLTCSQISFTLLLIFVGVFHGELSPPPFFANITDPANFVPDEMMFLKKRIAGSLDTMEVTWEGGDGEQTCFPVRPSTTAVAVATSSYRTIAQPRFLPVNWGVSRAGRRRVGRDMGAHMGATYGRDRTGTWDSGRLGVWGGTLSFSMIDDCTAPYWLKKALSSASVQVGGTPEA